MKIEIDHFGIHEGLTLDSGEPGSVLFAIGKNRVGKSTIRDAIEFALLGTCRIRGFALKKDVATYMIRDGAAVAQVVLHTGSFAVRRTIERNGKVLIEVDRKGDGRFGIMNVAEFAEFFPAEPDAVRVALDADQFYRMDDKARRALLISVKDSDGITGRGVWDAMGLGLTDYADADTDRGLNLTHICNMASDRGFGEANAQAVDRRRQAKRRLGEIESKLGGTTRTEWETSGVDVTEHDLPAYEKRLADLKKQLQAMRDAKANSAGAKMGQIEEANRALAKAQADYERESAEEVIVQIASDETKSITLDEAVSIAKSADEKRVAVDKQIKSLEANIVRIQKHFDETTFKFQHLPQSADLPPAQCPAASFAMKCTVRKATFEKAREENAEQETATSRELEKLLVALESESREAKQLLADVMRERGCVQSHWDTASANLLKRKGIEAKTKDAKTRSEAAVARVDALQEAIQESPKAPEEGEIEQLESRVLIGSDVVSLRREYDATQAQRAQLEAEIKTVSLDVDWWDAIEKRLRPDGIEAELASMATSAFSECLAGCDSLAKVRISNAMELTINGAHIATRSRSEQLCGGIAFQAAMAGAVGLSFLVIDEMDKMDAGWRGTFAEWAAQSRSTFPGGILALATSDADPPGVPPEGFRTAWLREGQPVTILGCEF